MEVVESVDETLVEMVETVESEDETVDVVVCPDEICDVVES